VCVDDCSLRKAFTQLGSEKAGEIRPTRRVLNHECDAGVTVGNDLRCKQDIAEYDDGIVV
jgi:hypothetical protein